VALCSIGYGIADPCSRVKYRDFTPGQTRLTLQCFKDQPVEQEIGLIVVTASFRVKVGYESRACRIQHVRAQSCAAVSAGRPRSPARWAAQSRLGGVSATRRLAATAQNLSSGGRRGDRVSCRRWGGMGAAARRQGRVGDGRR
jgi:hypothetical protein